MHMQDFTYRGRHVHVVVSHLHIIHLLRIFIMFIVNDDYR